MFRQEIYMLLPFATVTRSMHVTLRPHMWIFLQKQSCLALRPGPGLGRGLGRGPRVD